MAITINSTGITSSEIADGSISAADLDIGQIGGRRNLIINGAMQVAQRGTSFSSLTTGQYTLDRWEYNPSGATATITQESFAAGTEEGGCKNYLKAAFSVGNDNGGMIYKVEDVQSLHSSESFTLSFYAKGTNPTGGAVRVRVRQYFGSGGSATVTVYEDTITLTSSWQRFTITDTYDDLTGKTIGTGSYADITIDQPGTDSGTSAWELNITGVQLEVGSVATPFEHRSYGEELALCQRYFQKSAPQSAALKSTTGLVFTRDGTASTVSRYVPVRFVHTMRTTPTITIYDTNLNTGYVRIGTTNGQTAYISAAGDQSMMVYGPSGISHYETVFGYYLDAEL